VLVGLCFLFSLWEDLSSGMTSKLTSSVNNHLLVVAYHNSQPVKVIAWCFSGGLSRLSNVCFYDWKFNHKSVCYHQGVTDSNKGICYSLLSYKYSMLWVDTTLGFSIPKPDVCWYVKTNIWHRQVLDATCITFKTSKCWITSLVLVFL
jgi:hypothetical protein